MKRLVWRALSGCLIASLGACTGSAATPAVSHPAPPSATRSDMRSVAAVVTGYYRAVVARSYRQAFGYLAPGATGPDGRRLTLSAFLQLARELDGMGGPVTQFSIGGFPTEVVMTLYRVKYGPYHAHLRMVRAGHDWAIGGLDRI
jgi:hypothetical protein